MKRLVLVGALGVAFACGSAGNDFVDEMRDGAGDVMDDMGELPAVSAQDLEAYPVTCDRVRTQARKSLNSDGSVRQTTVTTTRFALVEVPDVKTVGIQSCGYAPADIWGITDCPPTNTPTAENSCTGLVSGELCSFSWGAGFHIGNKVHVQCDSQSTTTYEDGRPDVISPTTGWSKVTLYY